MFNLVSPSPIRLFTLAALSAMAIGLAAGCGRAQKSPPQEEIDLSKSTDIFAVPTPVLAPPGTTVVVVVEGHEVTVAEIDMEIRGMLARAPQQLPPERIAQMRGQLQAQVVENIIVKNLLRKAIDDENVMISDEEYNEGLERLTSTLPPDITLEAHLQRINMSAEELRDNLTIDLRINKLIMDKTASVEEATEEQVRELYESNQQRFTEPESVSARHILLAFAEEDDDQAKAAKRAKLEDIRKQLLEGADFAAMATEHSDCPSKVRGGDLGPFSRGQMVPPFEEAAFGQEVGAVGDIVETRFGYHLIKVDEHNEGRIVPFEEAQEQIERVLTTQARQKIVRDYIEALRAKASIQFLQKMPGPAEAAAAGARGPQ